MVRVIASKDVCLSERATVYLLSIRNKNIFKNQVPA